MAKREGLALEEIIKVRLHQASERGEYQVREIEPVDLITNSGRVYLAKRIGPDASSVDPMNYVAIGTATVAPALGDTSLPGEIARKLAAVSSSTDQNLYEAISTWGGAADSISSLAITEAGVFNAAGSGAGTLFQRVTFAAVTLNDSSFLELAMQTRVGSNTI